MTGNEPRGLRLWVYRNRSYGDTSNHGITERNDELTLVGTVDLTGRGYMGRRSERDPVKFMPAGSQVCTPEPDKAPAVVLVYRRSAEGKTVAHLEPYAHAPGGWMAGGTFATGDSRVSALVNFYGAIAVHDRYEG